MLINTLKLKIINAFKDAIYPQGNISRSNYDDEGTTEYFSGKTWQGHSVQQLRLHSSSLTFFSDEAFCYFLPAYMLAVLADKNEADVIIDSIRFHLTPPKGDITRLTFSNKWNKFNSAQKIAIIEYLDYTRDEFFDSDVINVLLESIGS